MSYQLRLKLGCVAALIIGPVMLVTNYLNTAEKKQIDREGIQATAIAATTIDQTRRGTHTYKLEVQYPVKGSSVARSAEVTVSRERYDNIESEPFVPIKYLKSDPTKLIVIEEPLEEPEMYVAGSILFLLGAVGTWWAFLRRRSSPTTPQP